jgi:drug/metabolite transporter (DMT)-like permease
LNALSGERRTVERPPDVAWLILSLPLLAVKRTCHAASLDYNRHMLPRRTETTHKSPTGSLIIVAIALAVIGWAGLAYLVNNIHPNVPGQAAFLVLWTVALIGTCFPGLLALHRRFRGEPSPWTVWRQSAWIGLLGSFSAWLQMNRVLNMATAAIVAGVFVVLEVISSWRARQETPDD